MDHTELVDHLRQTGHRLTPQREMILAVMCENNGHLTADAILKRAQRHYPYLTKSVVYRTLDLLTRLNLVSHTDFGQGRVEYEVHRHPHHHHLFCRHCKKMIEVDETIFVSLERALRTDYGFTADLDHFAIFGTCQRCQEHPKK